MYLAESVSKGGTCNTGADDDDVGAINVAELSVGEAVVVDTLLWRILLLQLPVIGIVITTNYVEKNKAEEGGKECPEYVLINHNHYLLWNKTKRPR